MKSTAQHSKESNKKYRMRIKERNLFYLLFINHNSTFNSLGFTLIEVLVATTILAALIGGVLLSLNPVGQINKSQDSQRMSDLQSIKTALDLYYDDNKCYPSQVPFGNEWRVNNTVYMKKVPQDPKCSSGGSGTCYKYRTSNEACPQWNVTFAELSKASTQTNICPLSSLSNCTPAGYTDGKFACAMSGGVNCTDLTLASIAGGDIETVDPTATSVPPPAATPTPTPTPDPNDVTYPLPVDTNPDPYEVTLNPLTPSPATAQSFSLKVDDPGVPITSVEVVITSDGGAQHSFFLNAPSGTLNNSGIWMGVRQVGNQETFYNLYTIEFFITAGTAPNEIVGYESLPLAGTGK